MARRTARLFENVTPMAQGPPAWKFAVPLAIAWLVGFTIFYFTRTIPNNSINRFTLAILLPEVSSFFQRSPSSGWKNLPERFDLIATAAAIFLGAWGLGGMLLRAIGFSWSSPAGEGTDQLSVWHCASERHAVSVGLGLAAWSLLTLGFGIGGWLSRPLFGGVIVATSLGEAILLWRSREKALKRSGPMPSLGLMIACVAGMLPFVVLAAFVAMLPPFDFDVKEYHLGGPKEWFLDGRVHFLPHNVYTSFPFLTEMLSLSAMVLRDDWFRGALAGQLILCGYFPLTIAAIFFAGRRLFGPAAGLLGALVYATTPWAYRIAVIAYAEGGLTCYLALALLTVVMTIGHLRRGRPAIRLALLTGLFAGSAMACKYPGLVQVVAPIGVTLMVASGWRARSRTEGDWIEDVAAGALLNRWASGPKRAMTIGAVYLLGLLISVGPWLLKNTVETRNPVYPLLWSVFDGRDWDAELNAKWRAAHSPPHFEPKTFFTGLVDIAAVNDWQGSLLFGLAPLALLGTRRRAAASVWLYVFFLYASWWLLTHRIDRFWVPLLPAACVLAGAGVGWAEDLPCKLGADLGDALRLVWRFACGLTIVTGSLFAFGLDSTPLAGVNPDYLADLASAARLAEKPGLAELNRTLPPNSKVLFVGEAEIFDARFPVIYNTVFDHNIFEEWTADPSQKTPLRTRTLRSATEIRRIFAEQGVTHIYVNWREILRYRTTYGFTPFVTPSRFEELRRLGLLGEPKTLLRIPAEALPSEISREAERTFPSLFQDEGLDRVLIADQLYPVTRPDQNSAGN